MNMKLRISNGLFFRIVVWACVISGAHAQIPNLFQVHNSGGGRYHDVAVRGDFAFCAAEEGGMNVVDIYDPRNPTFVANGPIQGWATQLWVDGHMAYVAAHWGGLFVFDVSTPQVPRLKGWWSSSPNSVYVRENLAFLAEDPDQMTILDISNPADPMIVGRCTTHEEGNTIWATPSHVYVGLESGGLDVIDIADPSRPEVVGTCEITEGEACDIYVAGNHAFLANGNVGGLVIVDVSNPATPTAVAQWPRCYGIWVSDDLAFVANDWAGLQVVDVSAQPPSIVGSVRTWDGPLDIVVEGGLAYLADGRGGVTVVDVSDPTHPVLGPASPTACRATDLAKSGNHLFVGDANSGRRTKAPALHPSWACESLILRGAHRPHWRLTIGGHLQKDQKDPPAKS